MIALFIALSSLAYAQDPAPLVTEVSMIAVKDLDGNYLQAEQECLVTQLAKAKASLQSLLEKKGITALANTFEVRAQLTEGDCQGGDSFVCENDCTVTFKSVNVYGYRFKKTVQESKLKASREGINAYCAEKYSQRESAENKLIAASSCYAWAPPFSNKWRITYEEVTLD